MAVELGLGVSSPEEIDLVPVDEASVEVVQKLREVLSKG